MKQKKSAPNAEGSQVGKAAPSKQPQEDQIAQKASHQKSQKFGKPKQASNNKRKPKPGKKMPGSKAASKAGSKTGSKAGSKTNKPRVVKWSVCRICNRSPKDHSGNMM